MFLLKTGNVLSANSIFDVDNIDIDQKEYQSNEELLNFAFKEAFNKLINRILLKQDISKISSISLTDIKDLISYYQIIYKKGPNDDKNNHINISFEREKINKLFYKKNISYADLSESKIVIFPILIRNNNFYIYSDNYFYNNWETNDSTTKNKFIEYILPVENIDSIDLIKKNIDNLEQINTKKILSDYDIEDYIFLIIDEYKNDIKILIKGVISKKEIIKNFNLKNNNLKNELFYDLIISEVNKEIVEIIKSRNLIDIRTPAFLNMKLVLKNNNDLLKIQNALKKIDLVENFSVKELSKNYAIIKIKYYGKINKIYEKLEDENIKIKIVNNKWQIELI
tara:strand:- start:642 stop:1658 length:1017 start_codon:yes stop_codon:yes gene_type:complete